MDIALICDISKRRRMDDTLRKSEEKYREMAQNSNSIILRVDKDLNITFANDFALRFFGYTEEEIIGKNVMGTIIPPADITGRDLGAMAKDIIQHPGNYINNIHENMKKNGELIWVSWTNKVMYDDEGNLIEILSIGDDLTQLKKAEEALQASEARFRGIFQFSPIGIEVYDAEGKLAHINQACANIFGVADFEEVRNFRLFDDPNLLSEAKEKLLRGEVIEYDSVFDFNKVKEHSLYNTIKSGIIQLHVIISPLFLAGAENPQNYLAQVQEITERKRMEAALRESEKGYRELVKYAPVGIYEVDFRKRRFLSVNEAMCQLTGYSREELLEMSPFDILDDKSRILFQERINQWLVGEKPDQNVEYKVRAKDGREIYAVLNGNFTVDENGKPLGATVIGYDITERKRMEEALKESEKRYRELVKYAPSGIFEVDFYNKKLLSVNDAMCQVLGYTREELLEMSPFDILEEKSLLIFQERLSKWLAGEKPDQNVEYTAKAKDGREIDTLLRVSLNSDEKGKPIGVTVISHDITERKKMEEALYESEQRYRTLFTSMNEGFALCEILCDDAGIPFDYRFLEVNDAYEGQTGFKATMIIGKTVRELFPNIESSWIEIFGKVALTGEPVQFENFNHRKDKFYGGFAFSPVKGQFAVLFVDVTESMQIRKALQMKQDELTAVNEALIAANKELQAQQEELNTAYRELQHQANEIRTRTEALERARDEAFQRATELDATISSIAAGIIIYDHLGNIVRINDFARNLIDYSNDDYNTSISDRCMKLRIAKSDGTLYKVKETPLYRALQGEIIRDEEMMIFKTPDTPIWLSATLAPILINNGHLVGVTFVFTDITERKRKTEATLASERELLKVTLNSLGEGVVATDQEERIIFINEAGVRLAGYSQTEAVGQPLAKILYLVDNKTSEPRPKIVSREISGNLVLLTRSLRKIPVATDSSPIRTTDGSIIGTVIVFQDISDKQKTERELLKAEKLESIGVLAGGIAHDFNNVLAVILSNIQLAMRKMEKNQDIKTYLMNTIEATRKASDLTKQLLTFSKGGAPVRKDASLIELIKDTTEFVLRGAKIKAFFAIPDDLWAASIDEGQISQVIHNLVLNAIQAMPKGGIIQVSAENISVGEGTRFNPGNYVKINLKDQGVGIAKDNLAKIFDPFFTTKKDGNGLGLATSYSIIKRHNGYLEVESQEGVGTIFFIYLPATKSLIASAKTENEFVVAVAGLKILLMDDEEKIRNAVGEMLKDSFGYRVILVEDGASAIELYKKAKESVEPFDVVIMDLTVPGGMGGQEAIAYLRDFDPKIKAIVSSGYANDPIIADFKRYGFMGVVRKPYKIDELLKVLNEISSQ